MLEWLSSKVAVAVAAMLLLSSSTAYFANQNDGVRRTEIVNVARGIASFVDAAFGLSGEVEFTASCEGDANLLMPDAISGSPYEIHLRHDAVIAAQEGVTAIAHWTGDLHFWDTGGVAVDSALVRELDADHDSLNLVSCERFNISIEEILVDSSPCLLAFAHPV